MAAEENFNVRTISLVGFCMGGVQASDRMTAPPE
jgi:dienelactone hydrolase